MNIKISLKREDVSVIAELNEQLAPSVSASLSTLLPMKGVATHACWGGSEIWTSLPGFSGYAKENETVLPSPGEILIVPVGENLYDLAIWYGRGWCFGAESGFLPGCVVGKLVGDYSGFAAAAKDLLSNGKDTIIIELA